MDIKDIDHDDQNDNALAHCDQELSPQKMNKVLSKSQDQIRINLDAKEEGEQSNNNNEDIFNWKKINLKKETQQMIDEIKQRDFA